MELIEHWWNGHTNEWRHVSLYLRQNPAGLWEVQWTVHQKDQYIEYATETEARALIGRLKQHYGRPGDVWRNVAPARSVTTGKRPAVTQSH